jgi:acetyl-CoA synthetase
LPTNASNRHADGSGRAAVRIAHADGADEILSFDDYRSRLRALRALAGREQGIQPGDRIAFMLEPSLPFYVCLFGAMQMGAISVPLFTLFGLDGLRLRVDDCKPKLLITNAEKAEVAGKIAGVRSAFRAATKPRPAPMTWRSSSTPPAPRANCRRRSSTRTRAGDADVRRAVRHRHPAGRRFFCPSSPAWGHGLWHGTLAPLALGVTTGTFAGRFDAVRLMKALQDYRITNMSAAATHYRMMKNSRAGRRLRVRLRKLSYTGEPIDPATLEFIDRTFHVPACSMYGTTEIGVVLVNYPGAPTSPSSRARWASRCPGCKLQVQMPDGSPAAPGEIGELMLWRRGAGKPPRISGADRRGRLLLPCGRADDVIISAGWTMSAVEIENTLLKHAVLREAA